MGAIYVDFDWEKARKELEQISSKAQVAVNRTIGDFKKRAPGWISQEIVKEYNIKKSDIDTQSKKSAGSIKGNGAGLDTLQISYSGRVLTPIHFSMTPKVRPDGKKKYRVRMKVKRSQRKKVLGNGVFLAPTGNAWIPFHRTSDKRLPIEAVKTVSIPQMITNQNVERTIKERMNTELWKRLEHHIQQYSDRS